MGGRRVNIYTKSSVEGLEWREDNRVRKEPKAMMQYRMMKISQICIVNQVFVSL